MANSKNIITVIIVVVASALIVAIFIFYGGSKSAINSDLQTVLPGPETQNLSHELLSALASLKDLKLDSSFFKDTAFVSLIDYSKDLKDEPVHRDNPFLPVEASVEGQTSTVTP